MSLMALKSAGCVDMFRVDEGDIINEYDLAEDAYEFECSVLDGAAVTYTEILKEPLQVGSHIVCTATPSEDHPWFTVNLGTGDPDSGRGDIAFHFNGRVPQRYVVRNTRRQHQWGPEETTADRSFPFKVGRSFVLEVVLTSESVLVAVDGEHYCAYRQRQPPVLTASWVQLCGLPDAALQVSQTACYPALLEPPPEIPLVTNENAVPRPDEPSWSPRPIGSLPQGLLPGQQLIVEGRLRRLLHSFTLEVCGAGGECTWPPTLVLLKVSVSAAGGTRQLVVLSGGDGAQEQRQRSGVLEGGRELRLRVVSTEDSWQVYAGSGLLGTLQQLVPAEGARVVKVRGDFIVRRLCLAPAY